MPGSLRRIDPRWRLTMLVDGGGMAMMPAKSCLRRVPMTAPETDAPETEEVTTRRISCDGGGGALGHPLVWMEIGAEGWVECGYCDKRFVLTGDPSGH